MAPDLFPRSRLHSRLLRTHSGDARLVTHTARVVVETQEHGDEHDGHHQAVLQQIKRGAATDRIVVQDAQPVGTDDSAPSC